MLPIPFEITKISKDNAKTRTLLLAGQLPTRPSPGQFVMAWLPGIGEKPIGVAGLAPLRLTIAKVGPFSSAVHQLKKGDFIWLRGPFGKGFKIKGKPAILIAGGYGIAPLTFLAEEMKKRKIKFTLIAGAKTKNELPPKKIPATVFCTNDGSSGAKGFATDLLEKLLSKSAVSCVYGCGPEAMLVKLAEICGKRKIPFQISLDRYMKCGIGICGSCAINGFLACKDGPVFDEKQVAKMPDFGKTKLDESGRRVRA
ncbi:MAG: dihydroorotate dehydrogenase electron transfer subunit [Candidatus Micrarchaeota archaeon]|nr:dihydroorotate dehydrogenase electron transfer subunit [Candidatus Micrarchaeota archaeon]